MLIKYALDPGAVAPNKAHEDDAGFDLYTPCWIVVPAHGRTTVNTGVHFNIPSGWRGKLYSKSGLMKKKGLTCRGLIDAGYTGPVECVLFNHTDKNITFDAGEKITQIVFEENPQITLTEIAVNQLPNTERATGGFGSTGR